MGTVHPLHRGPIMVRSDNIKSVRPITDDHLRAIFDVRPDLYDSLEVRRPTLFYRACDGVADLLITCVERPGTSVVLIFIGIGVAVVSSVVWATLA